MLALIVNICLWFTAGGMVFSKETTKACIDHEFKIKFKYGGDGRNFDGTDSGNCDLLEGGGTLLNNNGDGFWNDPNFNNHALKIQRFQRCVARSNLIMRFKKSNGNWDNPFNFYHYWEAEPKLPTDTTPGYLDITPANLRLTVDIGPSLGNPVTTYRFQKGTFPLREWHIIKILITCPTNDFADREMHISYRDGSVDNSDFIPMHNPSGNAHWTSGDHGFERLTLEALELDDEGNLRNGEFLQFYGPSRSTPGRAQGPDYGFATQGEETEQLTDRPLLTKGDDVCRAWNQGAETMWRNPTNRDRNCSRPDLIADPVPAPECAKFVWHKYDGSSAEGDPHCQNIKGEAFDVRRVGEVPMILVPRGLDARQANIALTVTTTQNGWSPCAASFITKVYLRIYGCRTLITPGPRGVPVFRMDPCSIQPTIESKESMITLDANVPPGPNERLQSLSVSIHQINSTSFDGRTLYTPYLNLQVSGTAIRKAGGILGNDDYAEYTVPPKECDGPLFAASQYGEVKGSYAKAVAA